MIAQSTHPYSGVAIAGVYNTAQARELIGHTTDTIQLDAALGVLAHLGLERSDIDGLIGTRSAELTHDLGLGPIWSASGLYGLAPVIAACNAVSSGLAELVLIVDGGAGLYRDRAATAPWTRPTNEFVASVGMFTAAEFALVAKRHMAMFGTTSEQLAQVAAVIRNNGHLNPDAAYHGRGPVTPEDVLASRMIADPFHLFDCSIATEGAVGLVVTTTARAKDLPHAPVYVLGAGSDQIGPAYQIPPSWDLRSSFADPTPLGFIGRRASRRTFKMAGLKPSEVQLFEAYDAFSFEVIRQLEAFEIVGPGEGGPFVEDGHIASGGKLPVNTDGGLLSYSHSGTAQALQRVGRAVQQLQGLCKTSQVANLDVALASYGGAGAMRTDCILVGRFQP